MQKQVAVPCRHSSAYCFAAISKGSKQTRASAVLSANTYLICAHQSLTCHIDYRLDLDVDRHNPTTAVVRLHFAWRATLERDARCYEVQRRNDDQRA